MNFSTRSMRILVKVKSKARKEGVEKTNDSHFVIHTKAVPEKGKANADIIRLLSEYFKLSQSHVSIISGHTSKTKVVIIGI